MTEASFQQARKLMQQLNYLRSEIKSAIANVARWTNVEMAFREQLKQSQADSAHRNLLKAIARLDKARNMFAAMQFPASDLPTIRNAKYCRICQQQIEQRDEYCITCYHNQNIPKYDFRHKDDKGFPE